MRGSRREFLTAVGGATLASSLPLGQQLMADETAAKPSAPIVDTHQHLWDLDKQTLPWLGGAPKVLKQSYTTKEYLAAAKPAGIERAVYMEVDVADDEHLAEMQLVLDIIKSGKAPTVAAVVGGRPASGEFFKYVTTLKQQPKVKGIRQVLHSDSAKPGMCLEKEFVRGVQLLGKSGLSFDLCMRPTELMDAAKLIDACPDTRFVVDHCGNADPKAFQKDPNGFADKPWHTADEWRRGMAELAKRKQAICKISGIVARAPSGWNSEWLAPIVNHCLDSFGPDRVVFGSDWPVIYLGGNIGQWVVALQEIISSRPLDEQKKLWHANADKFYSLAK